MSDTRTSTFRDGADDALTPADFDLTAWTRSYADERDESVSVVRGLGLAVLLAAPVWALVAWGASHLIAR